jgi:ankyrin repeat protein
MAPMILLNKGLYIINGGASMFIRNTNLHLFLSLCAGLFLTMPQVLAMNTEKPSSSSASEQKSPGQVFKFENLPDEVLLHIINLTGEKIENVVELQKISKRLAGVLSPSVLRSIGNLTQQDVDGKLFAAIREGNAKKVLLALKLGANIYEAYVTQDREVGTPLNIAISRCYYNASNKSDAHSAERLAIIKLLLENGANPNYMVCEGCHTALEMALDTWIRGEKLSHNPYHESLLLKIVELLLQFKADPNLASHLKSLVFKEKSSPAQYAMENNYIKVTQLLIKNGAVYNEPHNSDR